MNTNSRPIRAFAVVTALLLTFAITGFAQKRPLKPKPNATKIERLLAGSGFEYTAFGSNVWTVEVESNTIMLGGGPDTYVAFMTIAKKGTYQITAESMSEILRLADELDQVKFLIDRDADLAIRLDFRIGLMDQATFKDALLRVSLGHDQGVSRIAPFLVK
jgi:hypothetical protein